MRYSCESNQSLIKCYELIKKALTTISVMVGLSFSIVRQKIYDFWLLLHILLAVVVVVALY